MNDQLEKRKHEVQAIETGHQGLEALPAGKSRTDGCEPFNIKLTTLAGWVAQSEEIEHELLVKKGRRKLDHQTIETKYRVLKALENGRSRNDVCSEFKIHKTTLCGWVAQAAKIKEQYESGLVNASVKKRKPSKHPDLEKAVYSWYCDQVNGNPGVPVKNDQLVKKARQLSRELGIQDFMASNGWLMRFKHRHNLNSSESARNRSQSDEGTNAEVMDEKEDSAIVPPFKFETVMMDGWMDIVKSEPEDSLINFEDNHKDESGEDFYTESASSQTLLESHNKLLKRVKRLEKKAEMDRTTIAKLQERMTLLENFIQNSNFNF